MAQLLGKTLAVSQELSKELQRTLHLPTLGIYPRELKSYTYNTLYMNVPGSNSQNGYNLMSTGNGQI